MAKKQTRRSISVSRGTYDRLKAYCESNQISMSQFVERRVGDYLGRSGVAVAIAPAASAVAIAPAASVVAAPVSATSSVKTSSRQSEGVSVRSDAFTIAPAARPSAQPTTPTPSGAPTPNASRLSTINQPISQAVAAPKPVRQPASDEPMLKDPDAKLTADQIFTF